MSKEGCETASRDNMVMVVGGVSTKIKLDYEKVVRGIVTQIGLDSYVDDLRRVDSKRCAVEHAKCLIASMSGAQALLVACMTARTRLGLVLKLRKSAS